MIVRGVESNHKGFFKKEDVVKTGLPIYDEVLDVYVTVTYLKKEGVKMNQKMIDEYVIGFYKRKGMRGYSPIFDPIVLLK